MVISVKCAKRIPPRLTLSFCSVDFPQQRARVDSQLPADDQELHSIDAALTVLDLGHEGLRASQFLGEGSLGDASFFTAFDKKF